MRRRTVVVLAVAFALAPASVTAAAPGDFPEQPGDHLSAACTAVLSHGQGLTHQSATANAIVTPLYQDACLDG
jgi:hypothetical protein